MLIIELDSMTFDLSLLNIINTLMYLTFVKELGFPLPYILYVYCT